MSLELAIENLKRLYASGLKGELVFNFNGVGITDAYINKQRLVESNFKVVVVG